MDRLFLALFAYYVLIIIMAIDEQRRCRKYYRENACMFCLAKKARKMKEELGIGEGEDESSDVQGS